MQYVFKPTFQGLEREILFTEFEVVLGHHLQEFQVLEFLVDVLNGCSVGEGLDVY